MRDVALDDGLVNRRCKIHVADAEETATRIVGSFAEPRWRRLDKGEMLVRGDGARIGRHLFDPTAGIISDKSQSGFYVSVFGKIPGAGKVDRGTRRVYVIGALFERSEFRRDFVCVTQKEWSRVDENGFAIFIFGSGFKPPKNGLGEGLPHSRALFQVVRDGAVAFIFCGQQDSRAGAFEMDDIGFARLPAIEAYVIRPHTVGKGFVIKEWRVPFVD